jgi:tetratricopeptide (TPR) repeat protein
MFRTLFFSFGLVLLAGGAARADTAIQSDCLDADPRYSPEACAVVLRGVTDPNDVFRFQAAAGSAELARGKVDYALIDFEAAITSIASGAKPTKEQYGDVLAVTAIAHLRNKDPESALTALEHARGVDARNGRVPLLTAYAHFAAADPGPAMLALEPLIAASKGDESLKLLKAMFQHWQSDPASAVADCRKAYEAECGAAALALNEKYKAAADLVSSILGRVLQGDVPRMSHEDAPGAWNDCEAPEPQYAGPGCDQILGGDITPEERYAASVNAILAAIHNDDAGRGIDDGERLLGRLEYGAAKAPEDDPNAVRAHAVLIQADLARGEIDAASAAADAALADAPDEPTYLALRALVDLAAGVKRCQQVYEGADCGSEELGGGDEAGAMRKAATDINAVFLGDAERRFTLIGVDTLP